MNWYADGKALSMPQAGSSRIRGRYSPVQVLTGLEQAREGCTNRQVEEYWNNRKQGAVAKCLSEEPKDCMRRRDDADGNFKSS